MPTETAAAAVIGSGAVVPPAAATGDRFALNGTFTATSNGEWAKTNEALHHKESVCGIWTISSQCSYPTECTGTVSSDWGWTAPMYQKPSIWYVKRPVPDWRPCSDGTSGPAPQVYRFWPAAPDTSVDPTSSTFFGSDQTTGQSGNCGINRSVVIEMPFKMVAGS